MNLGNQQNVELENCRQQVLQLKKENEELIRNLYDVNEKLRDSERFKGHFISNVTNEIVNPFTSVLAMSQNIKQLKEGELSKAYHMAELIYEEAFHLDFQLRNIFAAALIEAGKDEVKASLIDLNELGIQAQQYFKPFLDKKCIGLSVDFVDEREEKDLSGFVSDKEKLDLILKNLISNSIKYSPDKSVVSVSFLINNNHLLLEVSDCGKGINSEDRKVIFDRFKQLDEKINSVNTGHGLGLSIVEAYAEMLGGWVALADNTGCGVVVKVCIPQSQESKDWDDLDDFIIDSEASY